MNYSDVSNANTLINIRTEIKSFKDQIKNEEKVDLRLGGKLVPFRADLVRELLDKELKVINNKLKLYGITGV